MVLIKIEMRAVFEKIKVFSVGTAAEDGTPNVAPIAFVQFRGDEVWLGDNYMKRRSRTSANRNRRFTPRTPIRSGATGQGPVEVRTEGGRLRADEGDNEGQTKPIPQSLLILRVEEVYSCTPGPGAGDRLPDPPSLLFSA